MNYRRKRQLVIFKNKEFIQKTLNFLKQLVLPGFQKVPFFEVMKFFVESILKGFLFQRAAAMTYNIFTAAIPLLMALIATMSFISPELQVRLLEFIHSTVPEYSWMLISKVIDSLLSRQTDAIFWLSLIFGIYLTFICINSIVNSLNITYFKIPRRSLLKQLPLSFAMVIVFFIIIIAACGTVIGGSYLITHISNSLGISFYTIGLKISRLILLFILVYLFLSALFYFAPYDKKYFRFFSAGSIFSSISLLLLLSALKVYFSNFSTYNIVYGSIGGLFIILLCIYWSSAIVLIGFDLNVSICIAQQNRKSEDEKIVIKSTIESPIEE